MSDNTLRTITKIVGVLFIINSVLSLASSLILGFGSFTAIQAGQMIEKYGVNAGNFPAQLAFSGVLFGLILGILYLVTGIGLLQGKKWVYKTLIVLAIVGFLSAVTPLLLNKGFINIFEIVWSVLYIVLANKIKSRKKLFS